MAPSWRSLAMAPRGMFRRLPMAFPHGSLMARWLAMAPRGTFRWPSWFAGAPAGRPPHGNQRRRRCFGTFIFPGELQPGPSCRGEGCPRATHKSHSPWGRRPPHGKSCRRHSFGTFIFSGELLLLQPRPGDGCLVNTHKSQGWQACPDPPATRCAERTTTRLGVPYPRIPMWEPTTGLWCTK